MGKFVISINVACIRVIYFPFRVVSCFLMHVLSNEYPERRIGRVTGPLELTGVLCFRVYKLFISSKGRIPLHIVYGLLVKHESFCT